MTYLLILSTGAYNININIQHFYSLLHKNMYSLNINMLILQIIYTPYNFIVIHMGSYHVRRLLVCVLQRFELMDCD